MGKRSLKPPVLWGGVVAPEPEQLKAQLGRFVWSYDVSSMLRLGGVFVTRSSCSYAWVIYSEDSRPNRAFCPFLFSVADA